MNIKRYLHEELNAKRYCKDILNYPTASLKTSIKL